MGVSTAHPKDAVGAIALGVALPLPMPFTAEGVPPPRAAASDTEGARDGIAVGDTRPVKDAGPCVGEIIPVALRVTSPVGVARALGKGVKVGGAVKGGVGVGVGGNGVGVSKALLLALPDPELDTP